MFDNMSAIILYYIDPKFTEFLLVSHFFWHWVSFFLFSSIKIINVIYNKKRKKEKANFRPHMGALFSAIILRILGQYNSRHVIKHVTLQFKNYTFSTKVEYLIVLTIFRTN